MWVGMHILSVEWNRLEMQMNAKWWHFLHKQFYYVLMDVSWYIIINIPIGCCHYDKIMQRAFRMD